MTPSQNVRVLEYRQILLWPFQLKPGIDGNPVDPADLQKQAARVLAGAGWDEVEDHLGHISTPNVDDQSERFQEYVYFHPFVRQLLFSRQKGAGGIRLFRKLDLKSLEAEFGLDKGRFSISFKVERTNIYLFDAGIAVLALELVNSGPIASEGEERELCLREALVMLEVLRNAYPPYWAGEDAGVMPLAVSWTLTGPGPEASARFSYGRPGRAGVIDHTFKTGEPLLAEHWQKLLEPLCTSTARDVKICQVVDERIPSMVFLQVDELSNIDRGDWVRLAMFDSPPEKSLGSPLPYGKEFLGDFEQKHCYDRHWHYKYGLLDSGRSSRYLMSGYGFSVVSGKDNGFINYLRVHFRRHYFQMGLLAQFEYATLLTESQRLADADRGNVGKVLKRLLNFTQKYWFVDVTNHVQGREIYALWRKHLNTEALYRQVLDEARAVSDFNDMQENRRTTEATVRLSFAALGVAVPSLVFGFLGTNLNSFKEGILDGWPDYTGWWFGVPSVIIGILVFLLAMWIKRVSDKTPPEEK